MKIGSLFTGAAMLDRAVEEVFGGQVAWHCEADKAASAVLRHHFPDTPNLGDITAVNWAEVEPVDVLCAGFPCQDVSAAGRRAGLRHGTRTGLWAYVVDAVEANRPSVVVLENVKGLLSATAHRTRTNRAEPACVCSSIDRWRGIYRTRGQDERTGGELLRPGEGGDDGPGTSGSAVASSGVGRLPSAVPSESRPATTNLDMVGHGHECDSVPPSSPALSADKGGSGSACPGGGTDTNGSSSAWTEWYESGMELARACRVRSDQEEVDSPEREGFGRCEECGGFVPAAAADCNVESGPAVMGDEPTGHLRALGAVCGDLADLGYDAFWRTVSAASVGAPHLRERVFVVAIPSGSAEWESTGGPLAQEARPQEGDGPGGAGGERPAADRWGVTELALFPSLRGSDGRNGSPNQAGSSGDLMLPSAVMRLPTPAANDYKGADPSKVSEENATKSRGEGGASSLADVACLLPTPVTTDAKGARNSTRGDRGQHQGTTLSDAIYSGELLPTPSSADGLGGHVNRSGDRKNEMLLGGIAKLLPTPTARLGDKSGRGASHPDRRKELCSKRGGELDEIATHILPTPNARDYKGEGNWPGRKPRPDNGRIRGAGDNLLPDVVLRELGPEEQADIDAEGQYLLPTPCSSDYYGSGQHGEGGPNLTTAVVDVNWGKYGQAVRLWESLVGPAPSPTEPNTRGNPRLSPYFSEWMMGWPRGWVCDVPGISRPDRLKICGNGVVPAQAAAALRQLLAVIATTAGVSTATEL